MLEVNIEDHPIFDFCPALKETRVYAINEEEYKQKFNRNNYATFLGVTAEEYVDNLSLRDCSETFELVIYVKDPLEIRVIIHELCHVLWEQYPKLSDNFFCKWHAFYREWTSHLDSDKIPEDLLERAKAAGIYSIPDLIQYLSDPSEIFARAGEYFFNNTLCYNNMDNFPQYREQFEDLLSALVADKTIPPRVCVFRDRQSNILSVCKTKYIKKKDRKLKRQHTFMSREVCPLTMEVKLWIQKHKDCKVRCFAIESN